MGSGGGSFRAFWGVDNPMPTYPIKTEAWHRSQLLAEMPKGPSLTTRWHVTALAYLQYGKAHKMDGPGVEVLRNGRVVSAEIEPELFLENGEFLCKTK